MNKIISNNHFKYFKKFFCNIGISRSLSYVASRKCINIFTVKTNNVLLGSRSIQTSGNSLKSVPITFVDRNGVRMQVNAEIGDTLLDVAKDNDIDGVEGACGGTLACSTCHCIFKQEDYDRFGFGEAIDEEELDMLDLAYGLTDTSRLVCQIDVTEDLSGIELVVPTSTSDARNQNQD